MGAASPPALESAGDRGAQRTRDSSSGPYTRVSGSSEPSRTGCPDRGWTSGAPPGGAAFATPGRTVASGPPGRGRAPWGPMAAGACPRSNPPATPGGAQRTRGSPRRARVGVRCAARRRSIRHAQPHRGLGSAQGRSRPQGSDGGGGVPLARIRWRHPVAFSAQGAALAAPVSASGVPPGGAAFARPAAPRLWVRTRGGRARSGPMAAGAYPALEFAGDTHCRPAHKGQPSWRPRRRPVCRPEAQHLPRPAAPWLGSPPGEVEPPVVRWPRGRVPRSSSPVTPIAAQRTRDSPRGALVGVRCAARRRSICHAQPHRGSGPPRERSSPLGSDGRGGVSRARVRRRHPLPPSAQGTALVAPSSASGVPPGGAAFATPSRAAASGPPGGGRAPWGPMAAGACPALESAGDG